MGVQLIRINWDSMNGRSINLGSTNGGLIIKGGAVEQHDTQTG
jgi:hypothetical protein